MIETVRGMPRLYGNAKGPPLTVGPAPMATEVHERLRSQQTGSEPAAGFFTTAEVADVVDQAADEILDAVDASDEGLRDAVNLMVNATTTYLAGEADALREAVELNYDENFETVLGWIETAV